MRCTTILPFVVLVAMTLFGGRAAATTQYPLSLEELTYVADRIVAGSVVDTEARFADEGRFIITYVEIEVDEVLKGPSGDATLTVWQLGGEVDGHGMRVEGTAEFDPGERVLLFLEADRHGLSVLGWAQGKFCVERDPDTGREMAFRGASSATRTREPDPAWTLELDDLLAAVVADVTAGHVPTYREIPGLLEHKRRAFRAHWGLPEQGVDR